MQTHSVSQTHLSTLTRTNTKDKVTTLGVITFTRFLNCVVISSRSVYMTSYSITLSQSRLNFKVFSIVYTDSTGFSMPQSWVCSVYQCPMITDWIRGQERCSQHFRLCTKFSRVLKQMGALVGHVANIINSTETLQAKCVLHQASNNLQSKMLLHQPTLPYENPARLLQTTLLWHCNAKWSLTNTTKCSRMMCQSVRTLWVYSTRLHLLHLNRNGSCDARTVTGIMLDM